MVARLARALVIRGLVDRDVQVLAINPFIVEQREAQAFGVEAGLVVIDHAAVDCHFAIGDQLPAPFARAYALRLQDAIKREFCHGAAL